MEGEKALARADFAAAESFYLNGVVADAKSESARFGLIRAYIGRNKVQQAMQEAADLLKANPKSSTAETASALAAYRAADIEAAVKHSEAAYRDNRCDGQAFAARAQAAAVVGRFAFSARLIEEAHRLRPQDELIRRQWMDSLPRSRRKEELDHYLAGPNQLSETEKISYRNAQEFLKARRPGECRVTSKAEQTSAQLQPVYGDNQRPIAFGLDVLFDGKRRRMQIDTGASGIILTAGAAKALGLQPEYHLHAGGVGDDGEVKSYLSHVDNIRIGDITVSNCMVEVLEKSKLDIDGLIGMDVFDKWLVTLDYQKAQLRLAPLPPRPGDRPVASLNAATTPMGDSEDVPHDRFIDPSMKDWIRIARIGHQLLIPAHLGNGPSHFLIVDTGASETTLSIPFASEGGKLHDSLLKFTGISGQVKKVYELWGGVLQFADFGLPSTTYYAFDFTSLSHNSGFEIGGLLGLTTLQRLTLTIDYRDDLMKLSYDINSDRQRF